MGSIQVTWGPAVDDPGGTPASQLIFSICYSTSPLVCQTRFTPVIKSPPASIDSNGNFSLFIKPLKPATTYYFLVRVEDLAGNQDSNTVMVSGSTMAGKLYLSNFKNDEILAFDKPSTFGFGRSNIRSIKSSHNGLTGLYGMFYDQGKNRLFISTCQTSSGLPLLESNVSQTCLANTSKIAVYNNTATLPDKDQIPDWVLMSSPTSSTRLDGPVGVFLDNSAGKDTLYVTNFAGKSVTVYDNISTSCGGTPTCSAPPRANFTSTDLTTPFGIAYDSTNQLIYVSNYIKAFQTTDSLGAIIKAVPGDSVVVLKDNGTPTLSEVKIISGFNSPAGLWLDLPSDTLYITNPGSVLGPSRTPGIVAICNVSLIPLGTQGIPAFSTPCTTASSGPFTQYLTGPNTGFLWPVAIAMTNSSNSTSLYISDYSNNNVSVFSPNPLFSLTTPYYDSSPDKILYGLNNMIQKPVGLAGSSSSGVENLFVANSGVDQVLLFDQIVQNYTPQQCTGAAPLLCTFPPTRMIGPSISGPAGLFLDSSKDRLYIGNFYNNSIVIFDNASTLSGNSYGSITKIITSSALQNPFGIYVDTSLLREWVYVVNSRPDATGMFAVLVFDLSFCPAGFVSCDFDDFPSGVRVIHSPDFNNPAGIWVDEGLDANNAPRDILFVSNRGLSTDPFSSSLILFKGAYALSGAVSATATTIIRGDQTSIFTPAGLYMDPEKDEVYVANQGYNDVLVFKQPQNCSVTPLTNICNTAPDRLIYNTLDIAHSLDAPSALTIDFSADQIYLSNLGLYNGFSSLLTINQATSINGQAFISNYFTYSTVSGAIYRLNYPEAVVLDITR
jgi:hypothetical protein